MTTPVLQQLNRLLVKGGRVVNYDKSFVADVLVEDGIIKDVGENLTVPAGTKTIEAQGKLVLPGGIDANTYLEYYTQGTRTADDFYSGTRAALAGGTTYIINYVLENKSMSLVEAFELSKSRAEKKACCDYSFHSCVYNYDDKVAKEMELLAKEKGVNSFKSFMSYKDSNMVISNEDFVKVLTKCKELGCLAQVHAENDQIIDEMKKRVKSLGITGPEAHLLSRPEESEALATMHACATANLINCPIYVVNVMSKSSADVIAEARKSGKVVFGEPIAASLATDGTHYFNKCWRHSAGHVVSPPLRDDPSTPVHLMNLLANGDLELASSNHCVFNTNQKALGKDDFTQIPSGVNGIEDRMSVIWSKAVHTGLMSPSKFVAVTSTNAAKVFNLFPRKGYIGKGSDADLIVWDQEASKTISTETHNQLVDFNVFEGMVCYGQPAVVIANGKVVLENGVLSVLQGSGRYLQTPAFSDYVYDRIAQRDKIKPKHVNREPYTGSVVDLTKEIETIQLSDAKLLANISPLNSQGVPFHHRPPTKSGGRNMQDSSFSFSGQQFDDQPVKSGIRVKNPPGGKSSGIF